MASVAPDKKEKKKKKDKEFEYEKQPDDEETLEQEEALGTDQASVKVCGAAKYRRRVVPSLAHMFCYAISSNTVLLSMLSSIFVVVAEGAVDA